MAAAKQAALCATCLVDQVLPEIGVATVQLLRRRYLVTPSGRAGAESVRFVTVRTTVVVGATCRALNINRDGPLAGKLFSTLDGGERIRLGNLCRDVRFHLTSRQLRRAESQSRLCTHKDARTGRLLALRGDCT